MLPSLLTRDIQAGLKHYLLTAYEPSDSFFRGIMERFLERDGAWMKGPYLQLGLPFRVGTHGREFFDGFKTVHPGFTHQEAAWERLKSAGSGANTLVATGTGSGKTECFLYPVLQHCAQVTAGGAGPPGIKVLILYPMNALATDQARRLAEMIHGTPAFKGIRAGLYVGGVTAEGGGTVMTPTGLITDRSTLRTHPPDLLLTNYKMLDYLLIRPRDRELWAKNDPDTLRYIVVDELHTFDGAQGTDLALLLRRLKARLKTPDGTVAHVGTSATLGGGQETGPLREYARQVFASPFPPESVIGESRLNVEDFLGGGPVTFLVEARPDLAGLLDPAAYQSPEEAVTAWFPLFFPGEPVPPDVSDPGWRQGLGRLLKSHSLFVALLRAAQGGALSAADLRAQLATQVADAMAPHMDRLMDSLLVLIAWARSAENERLPLVTLRLQTWMRELRRMVAPLTAGAPPVEIFPASELPVDVDRLHLPLIQCADCHTTAWLSRVPNLGDSRLSGRLEEIYNGWFGGAAETVRLYPCVDPSKAQGRGVTVYACASCGQLNSREGDCNNCGGAQLVRAFRPTAQRTVTRGNRTAVYHDRTCPVCGAGDAMVLIGSRSTTLGAQVVERTWGSVFNDDRKLIAFSDSVQDAAHRAGFISARTYIHTVRKAIAKGVEHLVAGSMRWSRFRQDFETLWQQPDNPLSMTPEQLVAEFIGPNMTWQRAWTDLFNDGGQLPPHSPLISRVQKRLGWQAFAEFTYAGTRGRNLERLGIATLAPATADIDAAALQLREDLKNSFGVEATHQAVFWWLWGLVIHLRRRGAVTDPEMTAYAVDGDLYRLTRTGARRDWMPGMGPHTAHPVFPAFDNRKGFDRIAASQRRTWYELWLAATMGHDATLLPADKLGLYGAAIAALEKVGVVRTWQQGGQKSAGLNADRLHLFTGLLRLQTADAARTLMAPEETATRLLDMPCLDAMAQRYTAIVKPADAAGERLRRGALRRVIAAEHTGLLERPERERLEGRFKSKSPQPWYENLLSATPTLEMGVDIGDLSSVMLCSVPPTVASFLQRVGRAGRRDGNACATTLADGVSPHDLYFYEEPAEMLAGEVLPPGVFLKAPEVLRRQFCAFCLDDWVAKTQDPDVLPDHTGRALDAVDAVDLKRFPHNFLEHVQKHRPALFDAFIDLLDENADENVVARLKAFVEGAPEVNSLQVRILSDLKELAIERKLHADHIKELRAGIRQLKAKPPDEATKRAIAALEQEQGKYQELVAEINGRELLNTLTDFGLIPNYAFPEAGVELKSVLWRRATPEDRTTNQYVTLKALRYERPASSALSEFAPENRFYATQRRVEVDQIHMGLAKLETWRLCPNCHHMENLEIVADGHPVCPRCQDGMWSDSAQRRLLLRFRQAIANSDDTRVRIDDSAEEREPRYYLRQLLVDFTREDVREAWMLKSAVMPFGFEFIASASFRDINFGESGKPGERFRVADREAARPGFRLCKVCGKVQRPPRFDSDGEETDPQEHAHDCPAKDTADEENILQCLYLYREFHSEALRILVPFTQLGVDDRVVQSFSAALQLGLKRCYGGKVDHLRVELQDVPDAGGGPKRRYLVLYDSVPGGTGYLHELLAHDARTLKQTFEMSLQALESCPCQANPEKDGCYRCVYQYRLGRSMELVSRRIALAVLRELVGSLDKLERTETISTIGLNHALESILERRFVESLKQLSKVGGLPQVTLIQEVVKGRQGYHLQVGDQAYTIELQVDLDHQEGVKRASRPDFVIRPLTNASKRRPIAVFCDGWTYHHDILRDDAAKRTAIVNSGRYWVWSVVMDDVEAAVRGDAHAVLRSPYQEKANQPDLQIPAALRGPAPLTFSRNSVAELLHWLGSPCREGDPWIENAWLAAMGWLLRLVPADHAHSAEVQSLNADLRKRLPIWLPPVPPGSTDVALRADLFNIRGVYPLPVHAAVNRAEDVPTVVWFDDLAQVNDNDRRREWRWWLWAFNWLQSVPGAVFVTRSGVDGGDYASLVPVDPAQAGFSSGTAAPPDDTWETAFGQMLTSLLPEARKLLTAGITAPEAIGLSLLGEEGDELSMAELAWVERKVAVLTAEYGQDAPNWEASGWKVVEATGEWSQHLETVWNQTETVSS
jgi:DEAD/DEAH box helicase domain-containing protein